MAQISFVVFAEQQEAAAALRELLEGSGHARVEALVAEPEELAPALARLRPDALLADLGFAPHATLDLLDAIPAPRPLLLVTGPQDESGLILRAMQQGAREYLPPAPEADSVNRAVERLLLQRTSPASARPRAATLAVMGAKGGVGTTVVACQLAACLRRLGRATALVDLSLPVGDVALHFDLEPAYTLANVARQTDALDATSLGTILQEHESGLRILAGPGRVQDAERVEGRHVDSLLQLLRDEFEWLLLDVGRSWNEVGLRALDLADHVVLVTAFDVPALHHARQCLDLLEQLGRDASTIHVVANRQSRSEALGERDVLQFLGRAPDRCIPSDYKTVSSCVNQGRSVGEVAPRRPLHRAFSALARDAHAWCGVELPQEEGAPGGAARLLRVMTGRRNGTA